MNWAWDVQLSYLNERDNKAGRRLLLVALGDNANEEGVCWPAISTLARRCESSTKSVRRWLREFEEYQLLSIQPRRNAAGQTSNLYQLRLANRVAERTYTPLDTESTPQGRGVRGPRTLGDQGPWTSGVPLTTNEPSMNLSHSQAGESMLGRADQNSDAVPLQESSSTIPIRSDRFPMTLEWTPDPTELSMACLRAGLLADLAPERYQLAKFTAHHADTGRTASTAAWHTKLADWLRKDVLAAQSTTGGLANGHLRQRTPSRRVTAAEARARAKAQQSGGIIDEDWPADRRN
ncbi:DnaT-like ssDNA-binding domain-containing protein [Billgrantia antri]